MCSARSLIFPACIIILLGKRFTLGVVKPLAFLVSAKFSIRSASELRYWGRVVPRIRVFIDPSSTVSSPRTLDDHFKFGAVVNKFDDDSQ